MLFFTFSYVHVDLLILMEAAGYYYFIDIFFKYSDRLDSNIWNLMLTVVELCYILKRLTFCKLYSAFCCKDRKSFNRLKDRHELGTLDYPLASLKIGILSDGIDLT